MSELIVMIGLPRAGKSTYVDHLNNYDIICADDIRLAFGVQFDPKIEPFVWAIHDTILRAKMLRKRNIVLDETNTVLDRINRSKTLVKEYDYDLKLVYIATPLETCLQRNVGKGSVPKEVIYRMNEQLQELLKTLPKFNYDLITVH